MKPTPAVVEAEPRPTPMPMEKVTTDKATMMTKTVCASALALGLAVAPLAARGKSPAAVGQRCIPPDCVARRSNTPGMLAPRALPAGRSATLGATPDFHHGLLGGVEPGSAPLGTSEAHARPAVPGEWGEAPCSAVIQVPRVPTAPGEYYWIDLVTTKRVPGTGQAVGTGSIAFARSPFGVAVSPAGHYVYDIGLSVDRLRPATEGVYTAWITTPALDEVNRLGVLEAGDEIAKIAGRVDWNKFLVVVTLEPTADEAATMWEGPVVMRGMSRSGLMHTLAGHGPFEREPCQKYGYR